VPVHGIGCQAHVDKPTPLGVRQRLDVLAATGLPIWLTELDVNQADENERANRLEVRTSYAVASDVVSDPMFWSAFVLGF
jgi:endo-1,4-beta-xylanase